MEQFDAHIASNQERYLEELKTFLRQPSIAAQKVGIDECAAMVIERLTKLGAEIQVLRIPGAAPLIHASIGRGGRTLMIYDHYDVQPPEPLDRWTTPAFEPTVRDGKLYARGVADNKGNLMLRIQAIESWLATEGALPLRVNFVIEGEEEIGSEHLAEYCNGSPELFQADGCLWETGGRNALEQPSIHCGMKGICYVELVARGARYDLHSANATYVVNPAWRLTWALATLKDQNENILIPGFYDRVRPPTAADIAAIERIPSDDEELLADLGIPNFLGGVRGAERRTRHLFSPTCTICGLISGYTGEGSKTVLPAEARAKIDFRMVPDQDPNKIVQLLRAHLDAHGFEDIQIVEHGHMRAARSATDAPIVLAMAKAITETFGQEAMIYPSMAGAGPMYPLCAQFGTPVASGCGTGYQGSLIHAPDENIRLDDYWSAMHCMGRFLRAFAA